MLIESLRRARKVATPIIAVTTADQISAVDTIRDKLLLNGQTTQKDINEAKDKFPMIKWYNILDFYVYIYLYAIHIEFVMAMIEYRNCLD